MFKIGVIGDRDTVTGFKALGLSTFPANDADEAKKILHSITTSDEESYAIVYITETLAKDMSQEIGKFNVSPTPAIILIPGKEGSLGLGQSALHDAVERAVGSNIL